MRSMMNNVHSLLVSAIRGGRGMMVRSYNRANPPRPEKMLELYDLEGCPFCRKVRETMSELDLAFVSKPSGKGANANRARIEKLGGKVSLPFLVDPNTGTQMFESEAIIDYLNTTYGDGRGAVARAFSPVNTTFSAIASGVRRRGARVREGFEDREQPDQVLRLYNFEASPYCRKVREVLHELNLNFMVKNVGKGSTRRPEFFACSGKMMVPYLVDPNTGTEMFESDQIVAYLESTYGRSGGGPKSTIAS